jgi:hypothetical protein
MTDNDKVITSEMKNTIAFDSIYKAEQYFKREYGSFITYFAYNASNLQLIDYVGYVFDNEDIVSSKDKENINYVHNKNTINIIFPHDQIRLSGSKSFMNKFPFIKTLLDGNFNNDSFIKYTYYDSIEEITGSTTIIVYNELESLILDKPVIVKQQNWETKTWWKIEDIVINNMDELISQFINESYYRSKFGNYTVDNYYDHQNDHQN